MRIALVTWHGLPRLDPDDRLLADRLEVRGAEVVRAVWSDPAVRWDRCDAIVVRSTWDYHRRLTEFLAWVDRAGRAGRLWNAPRTVRWNSDKRYLNDLARLGVPTAPTVWGDAIGSATETMRARGWSRAVLKPAVSANAEGTYRLELQEPDRNETLLRELRSRGEVMLQPYLPAVEEPGERSLIYLGGAYSHAVVRKPKLARSTALVEGAPVAPAPDERALADRALRAVDPLPLYARVDTVRDLDGRPCVAELELIEPLLYLASASGSSDRFAEAIARRAASPISAPASAGRE